MDLQTALVLAQLSDATYSDTPRLDGWRTLDSQPDESGFFGALFKSEDSEKYVISFRGSDPGFSDWKDWVFANPPLLFHGLWSTQFSRAIEYAGKWREAILTVNPIAQIYVTGHSLGGSLAQIAASMFGLDGAAFDPAGARNVVESNVFSAIALLRSDDAFNHRPGDFENFIVEESAVSNLTGFHIGNSPPHRIDADRRVHAYLEDLIHLMSTPGIDLYRTSLSFITKLAYLGAFHDLNTIIAYLNWKIGPASHPPTFAESIIEQIAQDLASGDIGKNPLASTVDGAVFPGTSFDDYVVANNGDNELKGDGGDDLLLTLDGNDRVFGGDGSDLISSAQGDDLIDGGPGNDTIFAGSGNDLVTVVGTSTSTTEFIDGGSGIDTLNVDLSVRNGEGQYEVLTTAGAKLTLDRYSSLEAIHEALAGATAFAILSGAAPAMRIDFTGVERVNLGAAGQGFSPSLVIWQNGTSYRATGSPTDTFFADWSSATAPIDWINDPSLQQIVNGTSLQGMERLLLITGSGNDRISNTLVSGFVGSDELHTGAGDDVVDGGPGNDTILAGPGNDLITVEGTITSTTEFIDGGSGIDTLNVDLSVRNGEGKYEVLRTAGDKLTLDRNSSLEAIHDAMAGATAFAILSGAPPAMRIDFTGVERVNLVAAGQGFSPSLAIWQNGTSYRATGSPTDTFFADWSSATTPIEWINDPSLLHTVCGTSLQGMERLLLITGSGNDRISNTLVSGFVGNDEFRTGAGDDVIKPGPGSDTVVGGDGVDTVLFSGARDRFRIELDNGRLEVLDRRAVSEIDTLIEVERLRFDDFAIAFDTAGAAGQVAKILCALFGTQSLQNKIYAGVGLGLLDSGMPYEELIDLAVHTDAFMALVGSPSHADFVDLIFRNVVGTAPSAAERDYFIELLNSGVHSTTSLALLACETPQVQSTVDLAGVSTLGLAFLPG